MKSVFTDIKKEMTDNIIASRWGDHIAQRSNIPYISGTSHIYYMADIISKSAKILGYTSDAALYRSEAELLKSSFNDTFYNAELGYYCEPDSTEFYQSAQILPLAFGIVPDEYTETLCKNLENLITKYESGIYGTKHIFNQLCQLGLGNLAYSLVNTTDYPGWGNIISQGATAFWERWETSTRSQSHHMFGTVDEWFYKSIAGISYDEVGFSSITIKPYTVGDLTWASGSVNTVKGLISSRWQIHENNVFTLQLSVPANTTATVYIPAEDISEVTESGMSATASEGVKFLKTENGYAVYSVGSGNYNFQSGNVSDDGITDIRDFIRLKRYLANPETPIGTYADYNGDGKIDANDLTSLKKKLLNQ